MAKMVKEKITPKWLKIIGVPTALIAGIMAAHYMGWDAKALEGVKNYHELKQLFPSKGSGDSLCVIGLSGNTMGAK